MKHISDYIADLWKPEAFNAKAYEGMDLEQIAAIVSAKEEGRRGRKLYTIEEITEYIEDESIFGLPPLPDELSDLLRNLEDMELPDMSLPDCIEEPGPDFLEGLGILNAWRSSFQKPIKKGPKVRK